MQWYIGWDHFHKSHQASLLRKHPSFYTDIFQNSVHLNNKGIDGYLDDFYIQRGYIWPSHHDSHVEEVLSCPLHLLDTYNTDGKPLFAPINKDTMKNASESKKRMYTVQGLREMCKERGIKGYSKCNKDALLTLLDIHI